MTNVKKKTLTPKDIGLYIGSEVYDTQIDEYYTVDFETLHLLQIHHNLERFKLVLRPLDSMTPAEFREIFNEPKASGGYAKRIIKTVLAKSRFTLWNYMAKYDRGDALQGLFKHHFCLFSEWFENDLAIDATTLNPNPYAQ